MPNQDDDMSVEPSEAPSERIDRSEDAVRLRPTDREDNEEELENDVDEEVEGEVRVRKLLPSYTALWFNQRLLFVT